MTTRPDEQCVRCGAPYSADGSCSRRHTGPCQGGRGEDNCQRSARGAAEEFIISRFGPSWVSGRAEALEQLILLREAAAEKRGAERERAACIAICDEVVASSNMAFDVWEEMTRRAKGDPR